MAEKAKAAKKEPAIQIEAKQNEVVLKRETGEEKLLFSWEAPIRPFKKRSRDYYTTIAAIAFLVIVILVFLKEFLLIAVVVALAFVSYVLAAVPPENTQHKLTSRGVRTANKLYRWNDLQQYWFKDQFGQEMVVIQTLLAFPRHLLLMLGKADKQKIRKILNERLPYEEPEPTFLDKSASWLAEKVPLERENVSDTTTSEPADKPKS
jgi:hypothetical protein